MPHLTSVTFINYTLEVVLFVALNLKHMPRTVISSIRFYTMLTIYYSSLLSISFPTLIMKQIIYNLSKMH